MEEDRVLSFDDDATKEVRGEIVVLKGDYVVLSDPQGRKYHLDGALLRELAQRFPEPKKGEG